MTILEPIGSKESLDENTKASLDAYHATLALYREQKWDEAEAGFKGLKQSDSERLIYDIYLDRISHFRDNPPGEGWDGVYTHTTK